MSHINQTIKIPNYYNRISCNYQTLIKCAERIHGLAFNYAEISPSDIQNKHQYIINITVIGQSDDTISRNLQLITILMEGKIGDFVVVQYAKETVQIILHYKI